MAVVGDNMSEGTSEESIKFKDNKALYIKRLVKKSLLFIVNPKKRTFIGRDAYSWGLLGIMYFVFYLALGLFGWAMYAIVMGIVLHNHPDKPIFTGLQGPMRHSSFIPGMGVRPWIGTNKAVIEFSMANPSSQTDELDLILKTYDEVLSASQNCEGLFNGGLSDGSVTCTYDLRKYLDQVGCNQKEKYGFSSGTPCVLVKLNNLFDWEPGNPHLPSNDSFNAGCQMNTINLSSDQHYIYVTCKAVDHSNVEMEYNSPLGQNKCWGGIPFYYYPYHNPKAYMQPMIVVKLLNLQRDGTTYKIDCSAHASHILIDKKHGRGYIEFSVKIHP